MEHAHVEKPVSFARSVESHPRLVPLFCPDSLAGRLPPHIVLPLSWAENDRGNTVLENDGKIIAWLRMERDVRLQVSIVPDNMPVMEAQIVTMTDRDIADHIEQHLVGWTVIRCNVTGPRYGSERIIVGPEDQAEN